ncbi:unnamed protein product [Paramecium pentaurelia]|uniref:Uncharacterized protein n=1 Tax=Paramecium pentaurelia TaxID=43138 RepID=A0A8S1X3E5_9CILI|nr:unnamed protein product [Paramecium pentaurelia]
MHNYRGVRPSTAKMNTLPPETDNLEEYMKILYDHQKACEKAGKYLEADCAKQRLKDLKIKYESKTKLDIRDRHEQEKYDLTRQHQEEMQNFNTFWDEKIEEFEQDAQKLKNELQQKQEDEMQQFLQDLEGSIPQTPKDSAELLSLKKTEEQLARQEEYLEAHKIQSRIAQLQKEEQEKWTLMRNNKIKNLLSQQKIKQNNETNVLNQRIENAQEEQRKIKKAEEEKLIQKYINVKKELEGKQLQELQKIDKDFKNTTSNFVASRMSKMASQSGSQMQSEDQQFKGKN